MTTKTENQDKQHSKDKEVRQIHQGKTVSDFFENGWIDGITYGYIDPIFDYLKENKDNKLCIEQYGDLTERQKVES
jgi:hypothetical protein